MSMFNIIYEFNLGPSSQSQKLLTHTGNGNTYKHRREGARAC